jgi:hypothetical protein
MVHALIFTTPRGRFPVPGVGVFTAKHSARTPFVPLSRPDNLGPFARRFRWRTRAGPCRRPGRLRGQADNATGHRVHPRGLQFYFRGQIGSSQAEDPLPRRRLPGNGGSQWYPGHRPFDLRKGAAGHSLGSWGFRILLSRPFQLPGSRSALLQTEPPCSTRVDGAGTERVFDRAGP